MNQRRIVTGLIWICLIAGETSRFARAETILTPWGNLAGMRVSGEPVEFEAGLRIVHPDWRGFSGAVKYLQRPRYSRTGPTAVVESAIEGLGFKETLEDAGPGSASLEVEVTARTNLAAAGVYYCLDLPDAEFGGGELELLDAGAPELARLRLDTTSPVTGKEQLRRRARGVRVTAPRRTLELRWSSPLATLVRRDHSSHPTTLNDPSVRQQFVAGGRDPGASGYQVYFELLPAHAEAGRAAGASARITAVAEADPRPLHLAVDVTRPGRRFDGIGGNVRLQFPKTDAAVLGHNLDNLRVAWGRYDLFWAEWDPDEQLDPLAAARAGRTHRKIREALETARTLARRRIPVIVSAWVPPKWACAPNPTPGLRGSALNLDKLDRICSSLAGYLVFLKEHSGVEAVYFSFNEPETGVEVRQTAAEHAQFIKRMGAELARRGLTTKLLLGDTAHGTFAALGFIQPSLADPATHAHIGAIAFHTWRGCTAAALTGWYDAARQLGVPLLVTESGPDAHMHEYPGVRLEPWFQLQEIELYVRCCAFSQPATIMEWQLTTDYSVLTGNDIYDEPGPLKPTQRFWNLKQLGTTPIGAFALPVTADRPEVTCAAFGDPANGGYAIHIVNRGNQRATVLAGLPDTVTTLRRLTTDTTRGMEEGERVPALNGNAEFTLPAASYTTLLGYKSNHSQSEATNPSN
jgi:hypothetical protein